MKNSLRRVTMHLVFLLLQLTLLQAQQTAGAAPPRSMKDLVPDATFQVGGDPDWMAVTEDAVWVTPPL